MTPVARPKGTPLIYFDRDNLYLDFGQGQSLRFPLTEGGLHKALAYIPSLPSSAGQLSGGRNIPDAKVSKKTENLRAAAKASPKLQNAVWEIVRKKFLGYSS